MTHTNRITSIICMCLAIAAAALLSCVALSLANRGEVVDAIVSSILAMCFACTAGVFFSDAFLTRGTK